MINEPPNVYPDDTYLNVSLINREFNALAEQNGWKSYHTPKNLAAAVSVEAAELLAEFQWLTADESGLLNEAQVQAVSDEVADVMMYLAALCYRTGIDMNQALKQKMIKNRQRSKKR